MWKPLRQAMMAESREEVERVLQEFGLLSGWELKCRSKEEGEK